MKVKKYTAPTMPEAMKKVRAELGQDVVILNSKTIQTGGFLGLFKKKQIEVVAAVEPEPVKKSSIQPKKEVSFSSREKKSASNEQNQTVVLEELRSLRQWIESQSQESDTVYPAAFESLINDLTEQDVSLDIAKEVVDEVYQSIHEENITYHEAKSNLKNHLSSIFETYQSGEVKHDKKFIHLVGPTGVGKTTTIAKLAANSLLNEHKKVAMITTDTYRIAAIEQLKTYAKILNIPIEIAYTIDDYKQARDQFKDYDVVYVDTAGRNFRDSKYVEQLGEIVDLKHDIDTYLVLSLTTKPDDLMEIYDQFHKVPLKKLIFTKIDETATYGVVLNLVKKNHIGVAYMTNGQDVPDDIKLAKPSYLTELLLRFDDYDS
ncbi:flagellar biosynthesis protein FlhF [Pelagirhabdus alkalitolerans]|uniref:Flagellar biosynthesis protein FlhF n=1 Tax=Pelagirhabdus alkalitolerans TaxID=1612202 RepID=A0A1G6H5X5_9BACI|nr:flagellar biosynthesis protein FlhF [Pelagirhabdus alkalitolerans]SDB88836.1 flagellar biosynthesis protein FlhF [Pelagirhabdus alkalitolerans]